MDEDKFYLKRGLTPPSHIFHEVTPDNLQEKMQKLKPRSWRQEGNKLIAETQVGNLVNYIPTNLILTGIDDDGLPVFKEV